ncbi:MAG TPA: hypothetical protein VFZ34_08355 [Blastocatellia bacterium]|nr:hypothetical protein [Blastocatellia bacterium]
MITWRAILVIYTETKVRLGSSWFAPKKFQYRLEANEISDALESFQHFPALARECSQGEVTLETTFAPSPHPLMSVTVMGEGIYWPSPTDTKPALDALAPPGAYDSVFVLWPQNDPRTGQSIPSGGWGLGMGASDWTNGATYATVANAPTSAWQRPKLGEVWLHEWLHGVCHHFAQLGYAMPDGDADGGGRHGYFQSDATGWCSFYEDLMTGQVQSGGQLTGIPAEAWRRGSLLAPT